MRRSSPIAIRFVVASLLLLGGLAWPRLASAQESPVLSLEAVAGPSSHTLPVLVDNGGPSITITSPASFSTVSGSAITVTGTAVDEGPEGEFLPLYGEMLWGVFEYLSGAMIEVGTVPIVEGRFTIPDVPLVPGDNRIALIAMDSAGNFFEEHFALVVTSDPNAPAVALVSPLDGSAVLSSTVSVDLNFGEAITLASVNGVEDGRSFGPGLAADVLTLPLEPGPNIFTLEIYNEAFYFTTFTFTLFRVDALAGVRIISPTDGAFVNSASQIVRGTVPLGTPYVTVNGVAATLEADRVSFSATVPVREGENSLQAIAHPFGQTSSIVVTGDFVPPRLLALLPQDGTTTHESSLSFSGLSDEPVRIELVGPGGEVIGTSRASTHGLALLHAFDLAALDLIEGSNEIEVVATDRAGNHTVRSLEVNRLARALQLVAPIDGSTVPGLRADIELTATEAVTIDAVSVAGRWLPSFAGQTIAPGAATLHDVLLAPGANAIRLVYHREGASEEILAFSLVADATDFATVTGTVTDAQTGTPLGGALVALTVNGTTVLAVTGTNGAYQVAVEPGTVTATATQSGFTTASFLNATLTPGQTHVADAALAPWGTPGSSSGSVILVGSIRSEITGAPESGVRVELLGTELAVISDANGGFVIPSVATGTQTLRLLKSGFRDEYFTLELSRPPDGLPILRSFPFPLTYGEPGRLAIASNATGTVRDDLTGAGLAGVEVRAGSITTLTDASGAFSLSGLPAGTLEITASGPGHEAQSLEALVVHNADDTLDFRLAALTQGRVVGNVTDVGSGQPIAGATVRIEGSTLLAAGTEADGSYILDFVPAGTYDLEIVHPEYLTATVAGVVVEDSDAAPADVALQQTPRTGALTGTIRDVLTNSPLAGAVVSLVGVDSSTTGSNGVYSLSDLPAGLIELSISAPGYAATTRRTAVTADVDFSTPTVSQADFTIDTSGEAPDVVSAVITAAEGGVIETPDKRLRLVMLPGSLTADAEVFLLTPEDPVVSPGDALPLDPALGLTGITAVGAGVEIRVAPLQAGDPLPELVGPTMVITRYPESDVSGPGLSENSLYPYSLRESGVFTAMQVVPHLHGVDRTNNITASVMIFSETMTGEQIASTARPIQVAQLGDILPSFSKTYLLQLAARFISDIDIETDVIDLKATGPEDVRDAIHDAALPFLVFHGWDPLAIIRDIPLLRDPLQDDRYGRILTDLLAETNGVYRPLFVTYNSRADLARNAQAIAQVLDPMLSAFGVRRGVPSFGFSMGGLAERSYQAVSRKVVTDADGALTVTRQVQDMISAATPHHGAAQLIRLATLAVAVSQLGVGGAYEFEELLRIWSPGTMQLQDYFDPLCRLSPPLSGNPFLCELNRNPASMPLEDLTLVGGTDARLPSERLQVLNALPLGNLVVGETPNDGIVPLRSAHARGTYGDSIQLEKALDALRDDRVFNHLEMGTDVSPISDWARPLITDRLTDWGTGEFIEDDGFVLQCPTQTAEGSVEATVSFDWNLPHESLTGIGLVVYVFDGNHAWRIASGADASTGAIEDSRPLEGLNSKDAFDRGQFRVTTQKSLPELDLDEPDPSTRILDAVAVFFPLGPGARFTDQIPTDPTELPGFTEPDLDHPSCPCPEPSNPTCQ